MPLCHPDESAALLELKDSFIKQCGFHGPLPSSLSRLSNLQLLELGGNAFSGTVDFNMFLNMKNLYSLGLSANMLSVLIRENSTTISTNASLPKFEILSLGSCNLTTFPGFLRHQYGLTWLDLSNNSMHGKVPKWIWNTSIEILDIHDNFFAGFSIDVLPSMSLRYLDFQKNNFMGALPIPPPSTNYFDGSYNELSGEISPLFFNLSSLQLLALSHNKMSGVLPECLRNTNHNLSSAGVTQMCSFGSQLQVMDLSYNQFHGRLPQSLLSNCLELKVLKLDNNNFRDVFPSWLGNLRELKLLLLRSNHFHGEITSNSTSEDDFPSLQIMDLSHNNFSGVLPSHCFQKWNAMKDFDGRKSSYLSIPINVSTSTTTFQATYQTKAAFQAVCPVTITNKGRDMEYGKILEVFTVIDLSSNRFHGDIPECLGNLRGLQVLNLSNNMLDGSIPSSLSNMTQLESLDLSLNKLSGEIPQQLVQLTFLAFFNVSFNRLRGLIPQGNQFSTFDISSYEGNARLRGLPSFSTPPRASPSASGSDEEDNQDSMSWFKSNWMTILPGFVGGLIFGVAIEHLLAIDERIWFIKFFNIGVVTKTKGRKGRKLRRTT
ncbi:hypothetical protein TIFTF001_031271 [Ficus carica]|uniref:Uncharacterized protein n=1 Tax=Ficus carica TaxID=3494 RepID=A0AA88E0T3_FICCA|nr:hypothetical protein TIFTF001_031271 [Ficus carica]